MQSTDSSLIAARTFGWDDQDRFARLSGDRNPIHVDAVRARRTITGFPVVHGVHLLLWTLDALAARETDLPQLAAIRARFLRFTYLDDPVHASITRRGPGELRLKVIGSGTPRCDIRLSFTDPRPLPPAPAWSASDFFGFDVGPIDTSAQAIDGMSGRVAIPDTLEALAATFPAAAQWIGAPRLGALAAATRLVGMIVPGLHSTLTGFDVSPCAVSPDPTLAFATKTLRHGLIDADIHGGGLSGSLTSLCPRPPVLQPGVAALRGLVPAGAFAGSTALVVGGSRGIGEVTAKLLAIGGAKVVLTYHVGAADALAVAEDIRSIGADCTVLRYDATLPAAPQLAALAVTPTHAYYFATPMIARPNSRFLDGDRLAEFERLYVHGLWSLADALRHACPAVRLLYPLTAPDAASPANLAEYAIAKAAGAALCHAIDTALAPARAMICQLPWMRTDQTNRLSLPDVAYVPARIIPALHAMHADRL